MKLAVFSRSTTHHFISGGMESQLKILLDGLKASGHDITVYTSSFPTENPQTSIEKGTFRKEEDDIKYVFIGDTTSGLNPLTSWEKPFVKLGLLNRNNLIEGSKNYYEASFEEFLDEHIKNSFDCIISQSTAGKGILKHSKLRIPVMSIIHGTIPNEIKSRFRSNKSLKNWIRFLVLDLPRWTIEHLTSNRRFFKRCRYIIAVSNDLRLKFLHDYPWLKRRVRVIYNGVDDTIFTPGKEKYKDFTVLYIGRMDREKGIDLLLNALQIAKRKGKDIHAKLIGMGIHIYEFKKLAKALGLENSVEFLGQIPNKDLIEYYQKSHVFVLPTRREEGHPMTLSEAYCSGLPVIATKKGGLAELIMDGTDGYYIDSSTATSLAYILEKLVNKPNLLDEMSQAARKTGEKKYSKRAMILGYNSLLQKI